MMAASAGVWFNREPVVILSPLEPSSDLPVFHRVDEKAEAAERRRIAVVVPREADRPVDTALLRAAKRLRNSPCSAPAKTDYLVAMIEWSRTSLQENLAAARRGEVERPSLSPSKAQASEYFDHMPMYGYVSSDEFRAAMKEVTPNIGLAIAQSEESGRITDMSMGGSACDRRRRGEAQPRMSWEPADDERL